MGFYASSAPRLRDGLGRDQAAVVSCNGLSSGYTATVSPLLRFDGLSHDPAEDTNVSRVSMSGAPRLALLQGAIVAATHDEVVRRTFEKVTRLPCCRHIAYSSLQRSVVPPAVGRTLRIDCDEDLAEVPTWDSGDVPPWLSGASLSGGPR